MLRMTPFACPSRTARACVALVVLCLAPVALPRVLAAQAGGSILEGVYTAAQAERGGQKFREACSACHNIDEMRGDRFRASWKDQSLGDLFDFVSNAMPQGDPGSLTADEYASIIAFFLNQSGYPAGSRELPPGKEPLSMLKVLPLPAR